MSINSGEIYTIAGKEKAQANDYFESGVVRSRFGFERLYYRFFIPKFSQKIA